MNIGVGDAPSTSRASPRALFLHGAGAWGGQWAIWRRVFEAGAWQVDTPDLQPAAAGLAATRLDHYVEQASAALRACAASDPGAITDQRRPPTLLVGASLGGFVALAAAARAAPDARPRALVLVNPLPPAPFAANLPPLALDGDIVPWRSQGRFASTVRALPDASFTDRQLAFRCWRDGSAAVLREARAGVVLAVPMLPVLVMASVADDAVPPEVSAAFANSIGASLIRVPGGHVDPVMGASAAAAAHAVLGWWRTLG